MKTQYVCTTYFIAAPEDEDEAYQTYRSRMNSLAALNGADVVSVADGLRMEVDQDIWGSLAEQYQIEQEGLYPTGHNLYFVVTVVNLDDSDEVYDRTMEHLIMDDPFVRVDRFPSTGHASTQIML